MTALDHVVLGSLFAFGSYQISGRSQIAAPFRAALEALRLHRLTYLINCAQCSGFWYGTTYAVGAWWIGSASWFVASCLPFVTSGACLFLSSLLDLVEKSDGKEG